MKKPFISIRRPKEVLCAVISLLLSLMALLLFAERDSYTSVQEEEGLAPVGIFGLMERNM